jgi:hypothetical protein
LSTEIGRCRLCGREPVAFDARTCPHCGGKDPNPGVTNRIVGRTTIGGALLGIAVGAIWGYIVKETVGAVAGGMLGALGGILLGLILGLVVGAAASIAGKR